jgi:acetyltransferase-like isoleucine patch superfamily enzyme
MDGVQLGDDVWIDAYAQIINRTGSRIKIGNGCYIAPFAVVKNASRSASIEIGNHCSLQHYSIIYGAGPVSIGSNVRIANHSTIVPVNKNFDDPDRPITKQGGTQEGIIIEDDIWIGSGVRVLDGTHVRRGSVLAAGTVLVRGKFPAYSVIAGVPGKVIKTRAMPKSADQSILCVNGTTKR